MSCGIQSRQLGFFKWVSNSSGIQSRLLQITKSCVIFTNFFHISG